MRIALFHNYYQLRGGEDVMFELESEALRAQGHTVLHYCIHNKDALSQASLFNRAQTAWRAAYNSNSYDSVTHFLRKEEPDISHVHNWFPLLSPSVYGAHKATGIPVVQTLHNYRLGCAAGSFRRNGENCNACSPLNSGAAVRYRCYRNSAIGSYAWKRLVDRGWNNQTFTKEVTHYVSPSNLIAQKHIELGLPPDSISVIPNACADATPKSPLETQNAKRIHEIIYLGRLVPEKGADLVIEAWKLLEKTEFSSRLHLKIIGTGPEEKALKYSAQQFKNIEFTGQLTQAEVMHHLRDASFLLFPSRWEEPFGLGVIEAMSAGKPVIASNLGGPSEIITHDVDGMLVAPDSPIAIMQAIINLIKMPGKLSNMSQAARISYEANYTPSTYANRLTKLFERIFAKNTTSLKLKNAMASL